MKERGNCCLQRGLAENTTPGLEEGLGLAVQGREEAGSWVGVELVEEGEGGRGEGVEGSRGQQHGQIPALVLCSTCQPVEEWVSGGSGQVPTRYPSTYQFLFQVCAKAVISTSWMRMKAKPPQTPV